MTFNIILESFGQELVDISSETGQLANYRRTHGRVLRLAKEDYGLQARQTVVDVCHIHLVLVVGHGAHSSQNAFGSDLRGEIHGESSV